MADAYTVTMPGNGRDIANYVRGGHVPDTANAQAQVEFAAPGARKRYVFQVLRWSLSTDPSSAVEASISDGTNTERIYITKGGPGVEVLEYRGLENTAVTFTIPATASVEASLGIDGYIEYVGGE